MISFLRICLGFWFALGVFGASLEPMQSARFAELGLPFIQNFSQREYGADSQNWAVVQDSRGIVYIGNNQGVLEFDGVRWRLIPTLRHTTVRSLALDEAGRVCVGGVGEIGYLAPDASGKMAFVDLTPKLDPHQREFSDIWVTTPTSQGLLFQSREFLFLLKEGRFQAVKADSTFHLAFEVEGRIFVRQREFGLMELVAGRLRMVPGGKRFARESIFMMARLGPSEGQNASAPILLGSRNVGLWTLEGDHLKPFRTEADRYIKEHALYHGIRLSDGNLALATLRGGVVLLDRQGRLRGILNRAVGLMGDNVKHLRETPQGCLWMALDTGIAMAEFPSPFSRFDERLGLQGSLWNVLRHQGQIYAATGQGLYVLTARNTTAVPPRFRPVPGISSGALSLLSLEGELLVGAGQGVFSVQGNRARAIRSSSNVAISLLRSKRNPARVFVGLQGGLASILQTPLGWIDEGTIPGVRGDVYSLAETESGDLWLGTQPQGVIRVSLPSTWRGGVRGAIPTVESFNSQHGLPDPARTYVQGTGHRIRFGTKAGFYRFDETRRRFCPDENLAGLFPEGPRRIRTFQEDSQGRLWVDSLDEARGIHETGIALPQHNGGYRWEPTHLRRVSESPVETLFPEADGTLWLGGPEGLLRYASSTPRSVDTNNPALLRRILSKGGGTGDWITAAEPTIPFRENALRFEFALPSFDHARANHFRIRLDGYDRAWSEWISETVKEYTNLPEGTYRFRVQGRNVYGQTSPEGTFAFRVLPPWYRTWWAFLLYFVTASGGVLLGLRLRTRLLQDRNTRLQHRVEQATLDLRERERLLAAQAGELAQANRHLQALNLKLRDVNEEKNQFLGVVVHDLRNPLNGILLATELIAELDDPSEIRAKCQLITRRGTEMNSLIGRFLDIAALDAGEIRPVPELISLHDLLAELIERNDPMAKRKGITLQINLPPGPLPTHTDPKFLRAVVDNLLSNALKFSPPGKTVLLAATQNGTRTEITIQDAGPGLTEEDQRKLYGRFAKLSAQPTGGEKSTGLGLSIVKKMVDAMGAEILVESQEGVGTTFRVILLTP